MKMSDGTRQDYPYTTNLSGFRCGRAPEKVVRRALPARPAPTERPAAAELRRAPKRRAPAADDDADLGTILAAILENQGMILSALRAQDEKISLLDSKMEVVNGALRNVMHGISELDLSIPKSLGELRRG